MNLADHQESPDINFQKSHLAGFGWSLGGGGQGGNNSGGNSSSSGPSGSGAGGSNLWSFGGGGGSSDHSLDSLLPPGLI